MGDDGVHSIYSTIGGLPIKLLAIDYSDLETEISAWYLDW